jgi:PhnB protein
MCQPGTLEKVMHVSFRVGDTTVLASDGRCQGQPNFQGFSLTLTTADDAEAERLFNALADGGQVRMPLAKTFSRPVSAWLPTALACLGWSS